MMLAVELFNRRSIYGKAVVATANDRDAAGLMGINTALVITFSYALSSMSAAFAGVLVAPVTLTGASMGAVLGLKAFAVAIIGGLSSGLGVIVGGLILGIAETADRLLHLHRLQGRAGPGAAAARAVDQAVRACSARPRSRRSERDGARSFRLVARSGSAGLVAFPVRWSRAPITCICVR